MGSSIQATLLSSSFHYIPAKPIRKGQGLKPKNKKVSFIKSSFVFQRAPGDFFYFYPLHSRLRPYVLWEECSAKKKVKGKMKQIKEVCQAPKEAGEVVRHSAP